MLADFSNEQMTCPNWSSQCICLCIVETVMPRLPSQSLLDTAAGLCIPSNNTIFIKQISDKLATNASHLTLEFLEECIQGFRASSIELKHLCLEYMTPWLPNLTRWANGMPWTQPCVTVVKATFKLRCVDYGKGRKIPSKCERKLGDSLNKLREEASGRGAWWAGLYCFAPAHVHQVSLLCISMQASNFTALNAREDSPFCTDTCSHVKFHRLASAHACQLHCFSPVCTRQASPLCTGVLGEAANMGEYLSWLVGLRRLSKRLICPLLVVHTLKKEWVGA